MPDFSQAIWMPSTRFWHGHAGKLPAYVIVHGTAGGTDARQVGSWLNTQTEREATSVHYVVGTDGTVVQLVSEADSAWGNGILSQGHDAFWDHVSPFDNPNWVSISIEHCKSHSDNSDQLTPAQKSASFRLIADICRRHQIPHHMADATGGITGHYSIDPVNRKFCPGPYPWEELLAYLNAQTAPSGQFAGDPDNMSYPAGVPHGWHDDGSTLTAPNNQKVVLGFRAAVLQGWNPGNYPLAHEEARTPANPLDPHGSNGTIQYFANSILVWESATNKVVAIPAGQLAYELEHPVAAVKTAVVAPKKAAAPVAAETSN